MHDRFIDDVWRLLSSNNYDIDARVARTFVVEQDLTDPPNAGAMLVIGKMLLTLPKG